VADAPPSSAAGPAPPAAEAAGLDVVRELRRLRTREGRERTGLCYVEGVGPVTQAWRAGAAFERVVVAPALLPPVGRPLVDSLRAAGVPVVELEPRTFAGLSFKERRDGLGAAVRAAVEPLAGVDPAAAPLWLALAGVGNPGNLGAVARTADAVGAAGLILVGETVDPHHPAAVLASRGTLFALRVVRTSPAELSAWKRQHGVWMVGTSPSAPTDYRALRYPRPLVVLLGAERVGLAPEERTLCDALARIPMAGRADSLNVAVAAGVLLYEVVRPDRDDAR
jgi:TrmH family RNA methyltransferase